MVRQYCVPECIVSQCMTDRFNTRNPFPSGRAFIVPCQSNKHAELILQKLPCRSRLLDLQHGSSTRQVPESKETLNSASSLPPSHLTEPKDAAAAAQRSPSTDVRLPAPTCIAATRRGIAGRAKKRNQASLGARGSVTPAAHGTCSSGSHSHGNSDSMLEDPAQARSRSEFISYARCSS